MPHLYGLGDDPAFTGYSAPRWDEGPTLLDLGRIKREPALLRRVPGLSILGPTESASRKWEAWRNGLEIEEARHESYTPFMDYLEARFPVSTPEV